jgi:CHAD domain-containing protein
MTSKPKAKKMVKSAGIAPETTGIDALRRLLREGAAIYEARRVGILESDDPEHVHQARVALRRLRSLVRGFSDMLTGKTADRLSDLLKSRFQALGPLRDADVHAEALSQTDHAEAASREAASLRADIREQLSSDKALSLKTEIEALLHDTNAAMRGARRQRLAASPVGVMASRALQTAWTELLSFGPDLRRLPRGELHEFRKRAKDMRYLSEFFGPVFADDPKTMSKRMAGMQDALGIVNDIDTMRAAEASDETAPGLPPDADQIEADALRDAQKAWKKLRQIPPWWTGAPLS